MTRTLRLHRLLPVAAALALAGTGGLARAQSSDPANVLKLGATFYDTHSKTNGLSGVGVPAGADAKTTDAWTALFTYERLVMPNLGIELALGVPPRIKADATGSAAFLGNDVLSARSWSPTAFVNYHFFAPGDAFRPYVGLGVNYTHFSDVRTRIGDRAELGDSWGWAAQGGLDWQFSRNWGAFASVARIDVKSKVVAQGATVLTTTIDFRPWAYSAGVSYRF